MNKKNTKDAPTKTTTSTSSSSEDASTATESLTVEPQKKNSSKGKKTTSDGKNTSNGVWEKLAAPFEEHEIEWRCGATNKDKTKCLALPYITNRAIQNRLDSVLGPQNWQAHFRNIDGGFICTIALLVDGEWTAKEDGASSTNFEPIKGGISDSMKRAAVQFGIGRYLYDAESIWAPAKQVGKSVIIKDKPKLTFKNGKHTVGDAENIPNEPTSAPEEDKAVQRAIKKLRGAETIDELRSIYETLGSLKADPEVIGMKDELKREFQV